MEKEDIDTFGIDWRQFAAMEWERGHLHHFGIDTIYFRYTETNHYFILVTPLSVYLIKCVYPTFSFIHFIAINNPITFPLVKFPCSSG
jgi:hypothetical protein